MGNNKFYLLMNTYSKTPICVSSDDIDWDQSLDLIEGNLDKFTFPIAFNQFSGKKWTDILQKCNAHFIFSNRFINLLETNNITGWKTFDIKITDKDGNEVNGYKGISITGRSGAPYCLKSTMFKRQKVPTGPISTYYKGTYFDDWDGSDFFMPDTTIGVYLTKRVVALMNENSITNFSLKQSDEEEVWDHGVGLVIDVR
jgi:hypothetical protein